MYTQNPSTSRFGSRTLGILLFCLLAIIISKPFVIPKTEAGGKQLELPFKEIDIDESKYPKPNDPKATPYPYNRRFDEDRLGTCIIYALIAPRSGFYLIPGCYGAPSHWEHATRGEILKVGRHWNPAIPTCASTDVLVQAVLNRRYKFDKKFPKAFIAVKIGDDIVQTQLNITILACMEKTTEASCESLEKVYITNSGGPEKLLLNCCCR